MTDLRTTIVRLLSNMASAKEIQQYLKRFSQLDAARFAVVKVGGAVLRDDLDALMSSLSFLQQVGLTPIVVHGAGPQLDERDAAPPASRSSTVDGLRYTDAPECWPSCAACCARKTCSLVEALQAEGVRATSIQSGVFEAEYLDRRRPTAWSARSRASTPTPIQASLKVGSIPVIASLGETADGQIVNINADCAANELVQDACSRTRSCS